MAGEPQSSVEAALMRFRQGAGSDRAAIQDPQPLHKRPCLSRDEHADGAKPRECGSVLALLQGVLDRAIGDVKRIHAEAIELQGE
jgi:hypothetical protein